jgi:hypothetical protein
MPRLIGMASFLSVFHGVSVDSHEDTLSLCLIKDTGAVFRLQRTSRPSYRLKNVVILCKELPRIPILENLNEFQIFFWVRIEHESPTTSASWSQEF